MLVIYVWCTSLVLHLMSYADASPTGRKIIVSERTNSKLMEFDSSTEDQENSKQKNPFLESFILTAQLGVNPNNGLDKDKDSLVSKPLTVQDGKENIEDDEDAEDFYDFQNDNVKKSSGSSVLNVGNSKVQFYKLKCQSGRKCTAIIPAATTTPYPIKPKKRSAEEIKQYLRRLGLQYGLGYTNDKEKNDNSVVGRYLREHLKLLTAEDNVKPSESEESNIKEDNASSSSSRKGKNVYLGTFDDNVNEEYGNYWPGSQYRPSAVERPGFYSGSNPNGRSKARIYKYSTHHSSYLKPAQQGYDWDDIISHIPPPNQGDKIYIPPSLPVPTFGKPLKFPYEKPRIPQIIPSKTNGKWRVYSTSTVAQYDKNKKNWVQVSANNKKDVKEGILSDSFSTHVNYHRPSYSNTKGNSHQTGIGLTVLGIDGEITSLLGGNNPSSKPKKPHYSIRPGRPHLGRPFQSSHYDSSKSGYHPTFSHKYPSAGNVGPPSQFQPWRRGVIVRL